MTATATAEPEARRAIRETPGAHDIDFAAIRRERLEAMHDAAAEVLASQHALAKSGTSVVKEVLREQGDFVTWQSYPSGDVYDPETHSQYFYHAHADADMVEREHGHFHTFLRPAALGLKPAVLGAPDANTSEQAAHLIAISVDSRGQPFRLFTTNRWVTGETWYSGADVTMMLDRFDLRLALPNWAVSRWLTGMVHMFRPQIDALVTARDVAIADWTAAHPGEDVYEDRRLQVTSEVSIDVRDQTARIEAALGI
jgi:hypothetical protein